MEHALVSVATGVLSPLIAKLSTLLDKEYAKFKGVRKEIMSLREELSSMNAVLEKLAAEDDPDVQMKEWGDQIRDLSYHIEDCIDDFMLRVEQRGHKNKPDEGFFHKSLRMLKALGARHDIADKIRELKARVDDVSKRRARYNFEGSSSSGTAAAVAIDPRLPALYYATAELVGIEGPRDDIVRLLTKGEAESVQKLRVVSIVGFGGLGKTTLANEVYRTLEEQFDCRVFVSVSQTPDMFKILGKILLQVKGQPSTHVCDVQDLIDELRAYLLQKRYFIVIDDLWDTTVWNVLRCAFPDNSHGSRVLTTTRVESVAATCCTYRHESVYKINPLTDEDSRKLFFNRIFGSEDACPGELKDASSEILRKCGGLPLAIITIASLLASQATKVKEDWEHVRECLSSKFGTDPTLEGMRQILNLSYKNLPPHLKTCFLYLGAYPEDCIIWKDDLVRQWIAEGFVSKMHGRAVDVAENYFNALVNRSMIQPVEMGYNDEVLSCRVHDMMLHLIIHMYSVKENFITAVGNSQEIEGSKHTARRVLTYSNTEIPHTIDRSKLRSLGTCVSSTDMLPFLEFKFLRVLALEISYVPSEKRTADLTEISRLFLLRYLKIHSEVEVQLPTQIRGLQYLETLEIVIELNQGIVMPSDIVLLPNLSYLTILPYMAGLPEGIGSMRSLRSLAFFLLEEGSLDNIKGLRSLTSLKELYIRFPRDGFVDTAEACMDVLHSSVHEHSGCKLYLTAWSPSEWFPGVPQWVGRVNNLYSLELGVGELSRDSISVLAGLPALVRLDLWIRHTPTESVTIAGAGFPVLKHLIYTCRALCLTFEAGAMPKLQRLKLEFNADGGAHGGCGNALVGIEHLSGLKNISVRIGGFGAVTEESDRRAAMSMLKDAIDLHPSHPLAQITCLNGRFGL